MKKVDDSLTAKTEKATASPFYSYFSASTAFLVAKIVKRRKVKEDALCVKADVEVATSEALGQPQSKTVIGFGY